MKLFKEQATMEGEFEMEQTLDDVFEEIAEGLAQARTRSLMGEREEALGLLQRASLEFTRFREVLKDYPGFLALEHDLMLSRTGLCTEYHRADEPAADAANRRTRSRRKTERAA